MSPIRHRRELSPMLEPDEKSFIRAFQQFQKLEFASPQERKQSEQYVTTSVFLETEEESRFHLSDGLSRCKRKRTTRCTRKTSFQTVKERVQKHETLAAGQVKSKILDNPVLTSLASYLGSSAVAVPNRETRGREQFRGRQGVQSTKKEFSTASHSPVSLEHLKENGRALCLEMSPFGAQNEKQQKEKLQQIVGDKNSMKDLFENIGNLFKSLEQKGIERIHTSSPVRSGPNKQMLYQEYKFSAPEEEQEEGGSMGDGSGPGFQITLYQMRGGSATRSPIETINPN